MFRHPSTTVAGALTFHFQIEPGADTHATTSDIHQDAANKNKPIIGSGVAKIHTTVSDIHRKKLKGRESADGRNQAVSTTRTLLVTEQPVLTSA